MANQPTAAQKRRWSLITKLGCIVGPSVYCNGRITIHHCGTGGGGRKDHDKVMPLCWEHHLGAEGIDGKKMSKRAWQDKYYSEAVLLVRVENLMQLNQHKYVNLSAL